MWYFGVLLFVVKCCESFSWWQFGQCIEVLVSFIVVFLGGLDKKCSCAMMWVQIPIGSGNKGLG
jgi:hypothetical protein